MKSIAAAILAVVAAGTADAATVRIDLVDVVFEQTGTDAPEGATYAVTGSFVAETDPTFGPDTSPFLFQTPSDFEVRGLTRTYTPENATARAIFTPPQPDPRASGVGVRQLDDEAPDPVTGRPTLTNVDLDLLFDVGAADALRTAQVGDVVPLRLVSGQEQGVRFDPVEEDSFAVFVGTLDTERENVVTATVLGADVAPIPLPAGGWLLLAGLVPLGWAAARRRA